MLSINCKEQPMRSSKMTRKFRAFSVVTLAGASVLVFHSAAYAQQEEPAGTAAKDADAAKPAAEATPKPQPPQDLPPEYAPPPGYRHGPPQPPGYPPPGNGPYYQDYYEGYPPPPPRHFRPRPYYQPAPPPRYYPEPLTYRPFFFGFGLGVGGISVVPNDTSVYSNASRAGLGYNLRFGFGVSPRWSIVLSADGAQAYFNGANVSETALTIGPQVFITSQLYARVGVGAAEYSQDNSYYDSSGYYYGNSATDSGMAAMAALGFEFMQHYHTALALEAVGTIGYFPNKDKVSTFGLNFVLNLF
jgi:hypothetical protein